MRRRHDTIGQSMHSLAAVRYRARPTSTNRPLPADAGFSSAQIYTALAVSAAASSLLLARAGLRVDLWGRSALPFWAAASVAALLRLVVRQRKWHGARAIGDAAEYVALFTTMALMGAVTSYPVAALTHGYADAALEGIDTHLGFDWLAWYRLVAAHRALQWLGVAAYENIYVTPAILLGWWAWRNNRREAHRLLAGMWLSGVITLSLFSLMPAVGPFSFLWRGPIPYMPVSELWQPDLIPLLRAHAVHVIDLEQLRGLVSAPSFHAASATLYIAAAWRTRELRWPLLAANGAMLLATPVEGTHYLADIILGAVVAIAAMTIVDIAMRVQLAGSDGFAARR
jgi:hypothetical protein